MMKVTAMSSARSSASDVFSKTPSTSSAARSSAMRSGRSTKSGPYSPSFSTTWGRFRITCTRVAQQAALVGQEAQARGLLLPAAVQPRRQQFSLHVHRAWNRARPKSRCDDAWRNWNKGDNGILDLSAALSTEARQRLARAYRRAACARFAVHVMSRNGASDVFSMWQNLVEGRDVPWALLVQRYAQGKAPRSRFHHRTARLGRQRRSAFQGRSTISSPFPRADTRNDLAMPIAGLSMAGWKASNCSRPRS